MYVTSSKGTAASFRRTAICAFVAGLVVTACGDGPGSLDGTYVCTEGFFACRAVDRFEIKNGKISIEGHNLKIVNGAIRQDGAGFAADNPPFRDPLTILKTGDGSLVLSWGAGNVTVRRAGR